jgi:hypothetical protein
MADLPLPDPQNPYAAEGEAIARRLEAERSGNMFDDIDPGMKLAPPEVPKVSSDNMFADLPDVIPPQTSATGAFVSHAARSVVPMVGGMAGAGAGAEAGAAVGALGGPLGAIAGGFIGGVAGFYGGASLTGAAQDWAVHQAPDNWQEALGQSDRMQRIQEQQHPYASFLGGIAPYALTMTPGAFTTKALRLPENATAFQRLMANPITARVFGGTAMGGMELGQEEWQGETPDWAKIGISTGFGLIFNKPTRFGEAISGAGANVVRGIWTPHEFLSPAEPTVAQANDVGVMGPGATESTFLGGTERSDAARTTAHNDAATEESILGRPPAPDVDAMARRIDPGAFQRTDELVAQRDALRSWIQDQSNPSDNMLEEASLKRQRLNEQLESEKNKAAQRRIRVQIREAQADLDDMNARREAWTAGTHVDTPDIMLARQHLLDTEHELWDLGPRISSARRHAADYTGEAPEEAVAEPAVEQAEAPRGAAVEQPEEQTPQRSPEEQRQFIIADRAAKLMRAGYPRAAAEASAHVEAAYYQTLAARFKGALGTAEDLYRQRAARVVGPGQTPPPETTSTRSVADIQRQQNVGAERAKEIQAGEATPTAETAPAQPAERPRLRSAAEIAAQDGLRSEAAVKRVQQQEMLALADWQAQQRAAGVETAAPRRNPQLDRLAADTGVSIREPVLAQGLGGTVEEKPVAQVAAEIVGRLPPERVTEEINSEAEAGQIEYREAEQAATETHPEVTENPAAFYGGNQDRSLEELEAEHGPAHEAALPEQRAGGGGEPELAATREGEVPEGGGPPGPVAEPGGRAEPEGGAERAARGGGAEGEPTAKPPLGGELYQEATDQVPLYSPTMRAVEGLKQQRGTGEQMLAQITKTPGVKPEELKWMGLDDWLRGQKSVTREQIADYVRANQLDVREVTKGGEPESVVDTGAPVGWTHVGGGDRTKYGSYTLPGGANYRELLITLPPKATSEQSALMRAAGARLQAAEQAERDATARGLDVTRMGNLTDATDRARAAFDQARDAVKQARGDVYKSPHWDEPNVLAHVRFDERTAPDGKRVLLVHEVQSDWHQTGRKHGYQNEAPTPRFTVIDNNGHQRGDFATEQEAMDYRRNPPPGMENLIGRTNPIRAMGGIPTGVPDAPFKTTWPALVMKRMLKYAVDNGFDRVAWAPGEVQNELYDLSKHIRSVTLHDNSSGGIGRPVMEGPFERGTLTAHDRHGQRVIERTITDPSQLADIIGKETADKLLAAEPKETRSAGLGIRERRLSGLELKIGGEGMKVFYDKMLPAETNKIVGRFGGKVGTSQIDYDNPHYDTDHPTGGEPGALLNVHTVDITPPMREAIQEQGLPLFQRDASAIQGRIRIAPGDVRSVITLAKTADASTFMHETAHDWLKQLMADSTHELAPEDLRQDAMTVRRWLKRPSDWTGFKKDGTPDAAPQERFARGFEQYLREGHSPIRSLDGVFAQFKQWLTTIYRTLRGLGAPITQDIREVFDRMLSVEPERITHGEVPERPPSLADIHTADAAETHPHEAEAVGDRVVSERDRHIAATHPELADAGRPEPEAGTAAEPGTETGAGPAGSPAVEGGGGGPEPAAGPGEGGPRRGTVQPGGGAAVPEGRGVSGAGARPAEAGRRRGTGEGTGTEQLAPQPAESLSDTEPRLVDLAGNIRVENLTDIESVAQAIHDSAERNDDFKAVRGGMTKGQMSELADALGLDPTKIDETVLARMFGGTQELGVKIVAARRLVVQSADIVSGLMKTAAESEADHDVAALGVAIARHDMIQSFLSGVTAEWGRAGNAFHSLLTGWDKAQDLNQLLRDNLGRDLYQLKVIAKLGARLDTPGKVSKLLRDAKNRSFGGMLLEYWINGLISGPATHSTYMVGNTILAGWKAGPETLAAATIGALRGREGSRVRFGEVGAQFRGAVREAPAAAQAAVEALKTGVTTQLPGESARPVMPFQGDTSLTMGRGMTNAPVTWKEVGGDVYGLMQGLRDGLVSIGEVVKATPEGAGAVRAEYSQLGQIPDIGVRGGVIPLGTMARLPSRMIASIHSGFRAMNYSMEINALAYRTASEEGLEGTAFAARVADLRQNPPEEMMERAAGRATDLTLMGQGGKLTQALSTFFNKTYNLPGLGETAILKFIDPFVHIAGNIMNQSLMQRTPVGLFSREIRADFTGKNGNIAQDTAMAKMLVGTSLALTMGGLAAQGLVSGSGPADPRKAAMWRLAGNQAHSVRIGDLWYDMHRLGPLGMLTSVAADLYDVAHQIGTEDADVVGKSLMHAFTQNILDESFMRGPADLIKAVTDPDRYGSGYVRNFLASFMPYSVGMAQMARASDPYSRQARTIMDTIRQHTPGLSESLFKRRDIWGEAMSNSDALMAPGVTAIYERHVSADPVNQAMLSLGIAPGPVNRMIRNVPLSDDQYDYFAQIAGRTAKMRLDVFVRSPEWQAMDAPARHDWIEETIRQARTAAEGMMFMKYPDIVKQATQMQMQRHTREPVPIH